MPLIARRQALRLRRLRQRPARDDRAADRVARLDHLRRQPRRRDPARRAAPRSRSTPRSAAWAERVRARSPTAAWSDELRAPAGARRGQGRHRGLPLARRARRGGRRGGRRTRSRSAPRQRGLRHALGPQGPRGPPAGPDGQGPRHHAPAARRGLAVGLYAGDDATDLDAFRGLRGLVAEGVLQSAVCVGVRSEETPRELRGQADVLVDGPAGVRGAPRGARRLVRLVRFVDLLKSTVLLSAGAATTWRSCCVAGASRDSNDRLVIIMAGWWVVAGVVGALVGRRAQVTPPIARALARRQGGDDDARPPARRGRPQPPVAPDPVHDPRAAALAFLAPQVPGIAAGFTIIWALAWRHQDARGHRDRGARRGDVLRRADLARSARSSSSGSPASAARCPRSTAPRRRSRRASRPRRRARSPATRRPPARARRPAPAGSCRPSRRVTSSSLQRDPDDEDAAGARQGRQRLAALREDVSKSARRRARSPPWTTRTLTAAKATPGPSDAARAIEAKPSSSAFVASAW